AGAAPTPKRLAGAADSAAGARPRGSSGLVSEPPTLYSTTREKPVRILGSRVLRRAALWPHKSVGDPGGIRTRDLDLERVASLARLDAGVRRGQDPRTAAALSVWAGVGKSTRTSPRPP